jgi:hypothetical protein
LLETVSTLSATLAKNLSESREMLLRMSNTGELSRHPVLGAQFVAMKEVLDRSSRVTFVTHGPGLNDPLKFGFHQSDSAQGALNGAIARLGSNARVALINHGGLAVPSVA